MKRSLGLLCCGLLLLGAAGCVLHGASAQIAAMAPAETQRLTIYTSHKVEVYEPIVKEFEERTDIWIRVVTGGTNELLERIEHEKQDPLCDIMFGGGVESLQAYADCWRPYTCSDAQKIEPRLRAQNDLWTPFSSLPVVLIYNTKLVADGELTGWADLLDPRWKGKIAFADPTVSGSSYTAAMTLLACLPGDDWTELDQFVHNLNGRVLADSGEVADMVAMGSRYVGITLESMAFDRQAQGADIEIVYPAEGTSNVPDGVAIVAGAPHSENAQAFVEFVQSRDVQALVVSDLMRRSVRTDVRDPQSLPPETTFQTIPYDVAAAADMMQAFQQHWAAACEEAAS